MSCPESGWVERHQFSKVSINDWCDALLEAIAAHVVGDRPDRFEPRLRKRRPKPYKHLREPRENYKRRVA
jgi:hypothetical protein